MITQTEILCLAIKAIDLEIEDWARRCNSIGKEFLEPRTSELQMKRETLKTLYLIQTGTNYGD